MKKIARNSHCARNFAVIVIACIFISVSVTIAAAIGTTPTNSETSNAEATSHESIIHDYISYLAQTGNSTNTRAASSVAIEYPGMGTEASALPTMTLDEAKTSGVLSSTQTRTNSIAEISSYNTSIATQQHDLVVEQFGALAWENVTYTVNEMRPLDGELGYRIIDTGELISKEEYDRLLYEYWEEVARQEGVSINELLIPENSLHEERTDVRIDLLAKHFKNAPVELTSVSTSQTYEVFLSFNGKSSSDSGYSDFRFVVDNRNGEWTVFQGLSWFAPHSASDGD